MQLEGPAARRGASGKTAPRKPQARGLQGCTRRPALHAPGGAAAGEPTGQPAAGEPNCPTPGVGDHSAAGNPRRQGV
eukprot:12026481-Alexandrium_andersonii.AAC.1